MISFCMSRPTILHLILLFCKKINSIIFNILENFKIVFHSQLLKLKFYANRKYNENLFLAYVYIYLFNLHIFTFVVKGHKQALKAFLLIDFV